MFWIILVAGLFIASIVGAIRNRDFLPVLGGIIVSALAFLIGFLCYAGVGMAITANEVCETRTEQICAISDNSGTFFVGRYSAKSSTYYCYLVEKEDGGKVMEKVEANKAIVYDDEVEHPYIVTYEKRNSNPIVRFFFWTDKKEYQIHIPPESIKYNFSVDLE